MIIHRVKLIVQPSTAPLIRTHVMLFAVPSTVSYPATHCKLLPRFGVGVDLDPVGTDGRSQHFASCH
jgi:hypothetical protein